MKIYSKINLANLKKFIKIIFISVIFILIISRLNFRINYSSGLNIIVKNNTNEHINELHFKNIFANERLTIKEIKPYSTVKEHKEINSEGIGVFYLNKLSETVSIPLAYIYNYLGKNILVLTINSFDGNGNIVDYKKDTNLEGLFGNMKSMIYFKLILLEAQMFIQHIFI